MNDTLMTPSRALIYIHGFRSSPQSEKSRALKIMYPDIVLATYDTLHPAQDFERLDEIVRSALDRRPVLVGSSLGGFWSYHFANKYGLPCVLLNPCMTPERTLQPWLGRVENMYTGEVGLMKPEDLELYQQYRLPGEAECVVLHEKGDELIPYQESVENFEGKARLILIEGGNHGFVHLEVAVEEINRLLRP